MPQPHRPPARPPAFTLLELIAVMAIIAILAALLFPVLSNLRKRPESIRCLSNMRSLHTSLASYIADKKQWPQEPENLSKEQSAQWWKDALKDYGATEDVWLCPSLSRELAEGTVDSDQAPILHYMPARFDEHQFTPYRWSTQPWLIERYDHGDGNFIMFPDGHIETFNEVYARVAGRK